MKTDFKIIKKFASGEVYTQSTMATPISIMSAARSLINARQKTNLSYTGFLFEFRRDYGSISYQVSDLKRLGQEIERRLHKDKKYFVRLRMIHRKEQNGCKALNRDIHKADLSQISDTQLLSYLQRAVQAVQNSVGVGHSIEAFALTADDRLKRELMKYVRDKATIDIIYSELATPEEKSFLRQADEDLERIAESPMDKRLIRTFIKKFYWIRTSYAGMEEVNENFVRKEAKTRRHLPEWSLVHIRKRKRELVKKFNIPKELVWRILLVSYAGGWQDERKKYIMQSTYLLFVLLDELARRTGVDIKYLKYLVPREFARAKHLAAELKKRREHSFFVADYRRVYVVSGKEAGKIEALVKKGHKHQGETLKGIVASPGKARGNAKICTGLASLRKVTSGDILVASMTRPEYISAMKKASAFVTDEGGITSHAAIVAREMKKPCIIGTKIATQVLKDGDMVEVDAERGIVKMLHKN